MSVQSVIEAKSKRYHIEYRASPKLKPKSQIKKYVNDLFVFGEI